MCLLLWYTWDYIHDIKTKLSELCEETMQTHMRKILQNDWPVLLICQGNEKEMSFFRPRPKIAQYSDDSGLDHRAGKKTVFLLYKDIIKPAAEIWIIFY